MDSARLDELEQLRAKAIQEKQSPGYSMDAQAAYIAALVLSAPDLIAHVREQEAKLDHMKRKHDTAIELYTEYHAVNGDLRNDLYSMEKAIEKLSNIAAKLCYNYGNNDCSSCPFGATPCKRITAKDWKEAALSEREF